MNSDREEIRRKLAMVSSTNTTSSYDGNGEQNSALISDYLRKPKQQHLLGKSCHFIGPEIIVFEKISKINKNKIMSKNGTGLKKLV